MAKLIELDLWNPSEKDLASHIKLALAEKNLLNDDNLYRGLSATTRTYKVIATRGTDRVYRAWEAQAHELLSDDRFRASHGENMQKALFYTNPQHTWAFPHTDLIEACKYAIGTEEDKAIPLVIVYDRTKMNQIEPLYHRFNENPIDAVRAIFGVPSQAKNANRLGRRAA